jgi:hypothetical protein
MYGFLDGQNYVQQNAQFITGQTITLNWNMSSPLMIISPVVLEETMNPNEWRSVPISIVNGGDGPLHWTALIEFGEPPTMAVVEPSNWSTNKPVVDATNLEESIAVPGGIEPSGTRDLTEYMECSMEEPLFSAPPQNTNNGQAFEDYYGWKAGQHFTLNMTRRSGSLISG